MGVDVRDVAELSFVAQQDIYIGLHQDHAIGHDGVFVALADCDSLVFKGLVGQRRGLAKLDGRRASNNSRSAWTGDYDRD